MGGFITTKNSDADMITPAKSDLTISLIFLAEAMCTNLADNLIN